MMRRKSLRLLCMILMLELVGSFLCLNRYEEAIAQEVSQLSPARRVFCADLDRDGSDELLIAHNTKLEALRWNGTTWAMLWSIKGPGVVQMTLSDIHSADLWVAWGMGKGKMKAPITLTVVDPINGSMRQVWTYQGGRSQSIALQWVEVDEDTKPELMIAHFVNKYHTRRVILDDLDSSEPVEYATPSIRMGTSWLIADIDGQPGLEEVIGRVYGDAKGEYGDLSVQPFSLKRNTLTLGQVMPTERGLKHLAFWPKISHGVFFSDGWVAAYGKKAKASLKRLSWIQGRPVVERLVDSPNEFTFFNSWRRLDPQSGKLMIFVQGNRQVSLVIPQNKGSWKLRTLLKTPPIVNAAIGYAGDQWWAFTPHESGAKAHRILISERVTP